MQVHQNCTIFSISQEALPSLQECLDEMFTINSHFLSLVLLQSLTFIHILIGSIYPNTRLLNGSRYWEEVIRFEDTICLRDQQPIILGPFTITPYLVDHSGYDAYALLVEAEGKRLFYSGDFRGHGRKASLFEKILQNPPSDIDVLLMEGTLIGREDGESTSQSESDLEEALVTHINGTSGLVLFYGSSQNIDRVVSLFRACLKTERQMIIDLYSAAILEATGNVNIPKGTWNHVRVFMPQWQRVHVKKSKLFHISNRYKNNRIYPEQLTREAGRSVMLFRPSMKSDLIKTECLKNASMVYSLWEGYLHEEKHQPFLEWLDEYKIPLTHIHTSGHASIEDLSRFANAINPSRMVPIHTIHADQASELFPKVELRQDGEWWEF